MPSLSTLLSTAATPPDGCAVAAGTKGAGGGATAGALFADLLPAQGVEAADANGRQATAGSGIDLPAATLSTIAPVAASSAKAARFDAPAAPAVPTQPALPGTALAAQPGAAVAVTAAVLAGFAVPIVPGAGSVAEAGPSHAGTQLIATTPSRYTAGVATAPTTKPSAGPEPDQPAPTISAEPGLVTVATSDDGPADAPVAVATTPEARPAPAPGDATIAPPSLLSQDAPIVPTPTPPITVSGLAVPTGDTPSSDTAASPTDAVPAQPSPMRSGPPSAATDALAVTPTITPAADTILPTIARVPPWSHQAPDSSYSSTSAPVAPDLAPASSGSAPPQRSDSGPASIGGAGTVPQRAPATTRTGSAAPASAPSADDLVSSDATSIDPRPTTSTIALVPPRATADHRYDIVAPAVAPSAPTSTDPIPPAATAAPARPIAAGKTTLAIAIGAASPPDQMGSAAAPVDDSGASAPDLAIVPPAAVPIPQPVLPARKIGSPMPMVTAATDTRTNPLARSPGSQAPAPTGPTSRAGTAAPTTVGDDDSTDARATPADTALNAASLAPPVMPVPLTLTPTPGVTNTSTGDQPTASRSRRAQNAAPAVSAAGSAAATNVAPSIAASSADTLRAAAPTPLPAPPESARPIAATATTTAAAGLPGPTAPGATIAPPLGDPIAPPPGIISNAVPIVDPIAAAVQGATPAPVIAASAAVPVAPAPMVRVAAAPADGPASASVIAAAVTPAAQYLPQPMLASGAAGRVFAAALHSAAVPAAASAQGAGEDHDPMVAAMLAGSAVAQAAPVVTAQGAGVDLRQPGWPTRMSEQIEALRDAADTASTSIRVIPDALGPVDLQVRRDGDQLHVHFSAANPETRTLIADAQPQLAAAAADRGLKLGQTSVGGGAASWGSGAGQSAGGQGTAGQGTANQSSGDQAARRSARGSTDSTSLPGASDDAATDTRIA